MCVYQLYDPYLTCVHVCVTQNPNPNYIYVCVCVYHLGDEYSAAETRLRVIPTGPTLAGNI